MSPLLLLTALVLCLVTAYYNGFHDASNAVSTAITTRSLRESTALAYAAVLNFVGALLGMGLTVVTADWALRLLGIGRLTEHLVDDPNLLATVLVVVMVVSLLWEILTWWIGMPSSTWHGFFGGFLGATVAIGAPADWWGLLTVLVTTLVVPMLAVSLAFLLMHLLRALGRTELVGTRELRFAQTASAGLVATAHGMNDARLPLALAVVLGATAQLPGIDLIVLMVSISAAVAAGTLMGGHRLIRTIGRRLTDLSPAQGLAAETSAAAVTGAALLGVDAPVSTSHALGASVIGAGVALGPRHVRWRVARSMVLTWVATPLVTALTTAVLVLAILGLRS